MSTRPPSLGPSSRSPRPRRSPPAGPLRGLIATIVAGALVVAALAVAITGGGDGSPQATAPPPATTPATPTTPPTGTGPDVVVPPAPEDPPVSVPVTPGPPPETPVTPQEPQGPPDLPAPRDVPAIAPLPVVPALDGVSWPDEKRVAAVALATGTEIARMDGRPKFRNAAVRRMKKTVSPNMLLRLQQVYATNPPEPKDPRVRGAITALSLQEDSQTGARIAVMAYWRLERGRRHVGVMRLEFAPAQAIVTDYRAS